MWLFFFFYVALACFWAMASPMTRWIGLLNAENGTAADEFIMEG
jgi:peptide methionine sulfoxide reductase MsrA